MTDWKKNSLTLNDLSRHHWWSQFVEGAYRGMKDRWRWAERWKRKRREEDTTDWTRTSKRK